MPPSLWERVPHHMGDLTIGLVLIRGKGWPRMGKMGLAIALAHLTVGRDTDNLVVGSSGQTPGSFLSIQASKRTTGPLHANDGALPTTEH
jgi:hypothetical protein